MEAYLESFSFIATFVLAITGASIAAESDFDFFGMIFLAFLTAVGGGTTRDIILDQPVFWTTTPIYLYIILGATFTSFLAAKYFAKLRHVLFFIDTLGLGLFAVLGTQKALGIGANVETAFVMGVITGVLGGVLRSIFSTQVPIIFKREIYATCAAIASISYIITLEFGVDFRTCLILSIILATLSRYLAVKYKIHFSGS